MNDYMKDEKQALVPKLRFPEFQDAEGWVPKKLGDKDVSEFVKKRLPLSALSLDTYVSTESILPDFGGIASASKLPPSGSFTAYKKGDVLIANIRPYLRKVWVANRSGGASNDVVVIRPKDRSNNVFLPFLLKNEVFINYVMRGAKGVKMPRGDVALMKEYPLALPGSDEQQKIADCLSSLDAMIAAKVDKLDALKTHKKALMQRFFPREGEAVPRLRFPEFQNAGEWEEVAFSTQVELISGLHLSPNQYSDAGEVPYFTGPSDYTNNLDLVSKWTRKSENVGRAGDTLVTVKGSGVGELLLLDLNEVALGRQLMAVRPQSVYGGFAFHFLTMQRQRLVSLASGNLIPGLSRGDILSLRILIPESDEQKKIADCLSSLDALIAAYSQKIDALRTHRKGLMQQLFPSPEAVNT